MQEHDDAELLSARMRRRVLPADCAAGLVAALDLISLAVLQAAAFIAIDGCCGDNLALFNASEEYSAHLMHATDSKDQRRNSSTPCSCRGSYPPIRSDAVVQTRRIYWR